MNLQKLFEMQRQLDEHIDREHPRQEDEDRLAKKILALQVELGELANELPEVFKFWSNKKNNREKALKEYVDGFHFILSIAIELGYTVDDLYVWDDELIGKTEDIFLELMYWVVLLKSKNEQQRKTAFRTICYIFFNMAEQRLGFTWKEIEEAYLQKNAVNHKRLESGY
jgi:dimeric dUTPase (all-alpha-NTP-PPase superfamily)